MRENTYHPCTLHPCSSHARHVNVTRHRALNLTPRGPALGRSGVYYYVVIPTYSLQFASGADLDVSLATQIDHC